MVTLSPGGQRPVVFAALDNGRDLMARNAGESHQGIFPAKGIQIASAQPDHAHFQQELFV